MDPDANLREQRRIFARLNDQREVSRADLDRLAQLAEALDSWIARGGFLPDAWRKVRR